MTDIRILLERKSVSLNANDHLKFIEIMGANIFSDFHKTTNFQTIIMNIPTMRVTVIF